MTGILVKVQGDGRAFSAAAKKAFGATKVEVQPILRLPARAGKGVAAGAGATWLRISAPKRSDNAWEHAHAMLADMLAPGSSLAAAGGAAIEAIEPDIEQQWNWTPPVPKGLGFGSAGGEEDFCAFDDQDAAGAKPTAPAPPGISPTPSAN